MTDITSRLVEILKGKIETLESELSRESDPGRLKELSLRYSKYRKILDVCERIESIRREIEEWRELADLEAQAEIETLEKELSRSFEDLLVSVLGSGRDEIVMEIRAGTGGEEAALFSADLFRMYTRYAERKGWKVEVIDYNRTDLGGYKEIVFFVRGRNVHAFLKYEAGVHRVQRVPITESGGRIHTSTSTVAVLPKIEPSEIRIDPKDLKVETFRASGHGGQYVNKTESAVRITHLPTGIVVSIQTERSQHQNREIAMSILRSKLYDLEMRKKMGKISSLRREQIGTGERSEKIRTYNFPQNRVTDHRIDYTTYRLHEVLDGDLDEIVFKLMERELEEKISGGDFLEDR